MHARGCRGRGEGGERTRGNEDWREREYGRGQEKLGEEHGEDMAGTRTDGHGQRQGKYTEKTRNGIERRRRKGQLQWMGLTWRSASSTVLDLR